MVSSSHSDPEPAAHGAILAHSDQEPAAHGAILAF
jgi:hypothetical protein